MASYSCIMFLLSYSNNHISAVQPVKPASTVQVVRPSQHGDRLPMREARLLTLPCYLMFHAGMTTRDGLIVTAACIGRSLAGKDYCSPYPSFRFWGSRYLCKHFPSFLTSLVTDMSLFVGQLWHCKSYFVFLSSWQLTREYISFYSSVNIPVIVATDMFHFTAYIIYIRTKNYQHKHFGELEFNYRLSNPW